MLDHGRRQLKGESRLARTAGARERDEPHVVARQQRLQLLEVVRTPDEGVRLDGQVGGPVLERLQRRKVDRQVLDQQLVEPLWPREVLQPVVAQVTHLEALVEQHARRLRHEHLAAVARGHHACGLMDVQPDVPPFDQPGLARMQPHSHADLRVAGPRVAC